MDDLRGLKWDGEALEFIEQTLLPHEEQWVRTDDWTVVVDAIKRLAIRGAPAIGVAGACAVVLAHKSSANDAEFQHAMDAIANARPTAVNLAWAVNRLRDRIANLSSSEEIHQTLQRETAIIAEEDALMCNQMAEHGQQLIPDGARALTHCNTGVLVTYGIGTALGVLRRSHELKRLSHVYACEARPLGQGARLTMWELGKLGIPGTLLSDSAAGSLMQSGKVDLVILGADRVAANGDTANKIGTFQLAVLARRFKIPFYVAAPSSTFDLSLPTGESIPVEERHPDEVRTYRGTQISPKGVNVFNPAFDVTPVELITAFIREDGVFYPPCEFPAGKA
ncbi:S-methyl-5-thioribose-1-phosphate isomerase [bacterium]|nr:S-methyl-5-thioribose-1-phosphate isomerase [bacterium]